MDQDHNQQSYPQGSTSERVRAVQELFTPLYDDVDDDEIVRERPLLAHYTSIATLEKILKSSELWLSNPLFMNDYAEVRFVLEHAVPSVFRHEGARDACGTRERASIFYGAFDANRARFVDDEVMDTFVFCLSAHNPADKNGVLSMWRGYGGSGSGATIVFSTAKFKRVGASPLILAKVRYGSAPDRDEWIASKLDQFSEIIRNNHISDEELYIPAWALFERLKVAALFAKHESFREEQEWRLVYLASRDGEGRHRPQFDYFVGPRGVEPKLKLQVSPEVLGEGITLPNIVDRMILGPTASSPLALAAARRMLDKLKLPELKDRVYASSIPFRG